MSEELADPRCIACGGRGYTLGGSGSHDCDCVRERVRQIARLACPVCAVPRAKAEDLLCPSCWTLVHPDDQAELIRLRRDANGSDTHRIKCSAVVRDLDRRRADLVEATR